MRGEPPQCCTVPLTAKRHRKEGSEREKEEDEEGEGEGDWSCAKLVVAPGRWLTSSQRILINGFAGAIDVWLPRLVPRQQSCSGHCQHGSVAR